MLLFLTLYKNLDFTAKRYVYHDLKVDVFRMRLIKYKLSIRQQLVAGFSSVVQSCSKFRDLINWHIRYNAVGLMNNKANFFFGCLRHDESEKRLPKSCLVLLCKYDPVLRWSRDCDNTLYQGLVEMLIPDVLRPIPSEFPHVPSIQIYSMCQSWWWSSAESHFARSGLFLLTLIFANLDVGRHSGCWGTNYGRIVHCHTTSYILNIISDLIISHHILIISPGALTQAIRNFAKSLESWLTNAMMNIPEEMVRVKVSDRSKLLTFN